MKPAGIANTIDLPTFRRASFHEQPVVGCCGFPTILPVLFVNLPVNPFHLCTYLLFGLMLYLNPFLNPYHAGIANTIDLPERMLPRIASRMGLRRVAFNPYTREQLQEIVADRLAGIPAFQPEAIELASRKVSPSFRPSMSDLFFFIWF